MRRTSGISLMLLIFLSLCLIIFSLLSLSGAVADETLSTQAADRTSEYYAAVTEANARLAGIDRQLAGCLRKAQDAAAADAQDAADTGTQGPAAADEAQDTAGSDAQAPAAAGAQDAYLQLCSRIGDALPGVTWSDGLLSFSVDVDEDQILQVGVEPVWPSFDTDPLYRIRTWKIVNTGDWTADRTMHLFRTGQ